MSARVFNGRVYADHFESHLKTHIKNLSYSPRLASVVFVEDKSSLTYTRLKMEAASRVGIEFDIMN